MSATLIGTFTPGSPEWHAARAEGVGGSEVAAILGLSPWESRFSLFHRKRGELPPVELSGAMEWGNRLEPVVLEKFYDEHRDLTPGVGFTQGTWRNDARPWQIANPDSIAFDVQTDERSIIEIKTARYGDDWGPSGSDIFPIHYRCQVLWYLDCLGLKRGHLAVLIAGSDYREYVIKYDEAEALFMREQVAQFVADLANDVRPDIDGHTATLNTVKALPEGATGDSVEVGHLTATKYRSALRTFTEAESAKREISSHLLDAIGDGKYAVTPDGQRVAMRAVTQDGRTHSLRPCKEPTT